MPGIPSGRGQPSTTNEPGTPSGKRSRRKKLRWLSIFSRSTRANTAALDLPIQEVPPQQTLNSQFQEAKHVVINGGHIASGHQTVLTVNLHQTGHGYPMPMIQVTALDSDEATLDGLATGKAETTGSSSMHGEDGDTVTSESNLTPQAFLPTKTCNEVYDSHLSPKKRGYALWIPEPNKNLPAPYQRKGIQIGDVGIITPDGGFSFIFNVCVAHDNPVNPRDLPENFAPIHPPIDPIDIRRFSSFKADSYLASTSIERSQDDATSPGLSFRTLAPEGAILTMPEGAISHDLENVPRFREYAIANVYKWYKYINGVRGREAKNGDVRLVVGCDKATSWGMANTYKHSQLKFKPIDVQAPCSPGRGYTWEYSGIADVKVGPGQEEVDELRREDPDDSITGNKYRNQCLFVRTLNVTLNDDEWENLNSEISIGYTPGSATGPENKTSSLSPSHRNISPDTTQSTSSAGGNFGTRRAAGDSSALEPALLEERANRLFLSAPPTALSCHPSRVLNDTLLKMFPSAKMVVTHDEDWYSCIQEDMAMSADPKQIIASVSTKNDIREESGVLYLEPKVSREMKYFTDLEQLSFELKNNSSNLEQYLCGDNPGRSARWNEMIFLLELCHDALSPSDSESHHSLLSQESPPSDTKRIRDIESLLGSLLIDELFLDSPGTFELIYALRPLSQATQPSSSAFRIETFKKLSSILGRVSTGTEYLNPSIEREKLATSEVGPRGFKNILAHSSELYLLYLAQGESADLKETIESLRQQKVPEWTALDSSQIPSVEEDTRRDSPPACPINQLTSYLRETTSEQQIESNSHVPDTDDADQSHRKEKTKGVNPDQSEDDEYEARQGLLDNQRAVQSHKTETERAAIAISRPKAGGESDEKSDDEVVSEVGRLARTQGASNKMKTKAGSRPVVLSAESTFTNMNRDNRPSPIISEPPSHYFPQTGYCGEPSPYQPELSSHSEITIVNSSNNEFSSTAGTAVDSFPCTHPHFHLPKSDRRETDPRPVRPPQGKPPGKQRRTQ